MAKGPDGGLLLGCEPFDRSTDVIGVRTQVFPAIGTMARLTATVPIGIVGGVQT
jgi:hypothetical protein